MQRERVNDDNISMINDAQEVGRRFGYLIGKFGNRNLAEGNREIQQEV